MEVPLENGPIKQILVDPFSIMTMAPSAFAAF